MIKLTYWHDTALGNVMTFFRLAHDGRQFTALRPKVHLLICITEALRFPIMLGTQHKVGTLE